MHGLLAPLFAQLVTLAFANRIEGHYVLNRDEHYFESTETATPGAALTLTWRRAALTFAYTPSLQLVPILSSQTEPREVLLSQRTSVNFQYHWRDTTLTAGSSGVYGQRDFSQEAIAAGQPVVVAPGANAGNQPVQGQQQGQPGTGTPPATAGTGTTPTGGQTGTGTPTPANTPAHATGRVDYVSVRANGALEHFISRVVSWRVAAGYSINGGLGPTAQENYPLTRGPDGSLSVRVALDTRNAFTTLLVGQLIYGGEGNNASVATLGEDYAHNFTRRLLMTAGAGVSFTRTLPGHVTLPEPQYSVYPAGRATISDQSRLGRGTLTVNAGTTASPVLDTGTGPTATITVDPRLAFFGGAGWRLDRFALTFTTSTQLSLAPKSPNAFSAVYAGIDAGYMLPANFTVNGGVRGAWQQYTNPQTGRADLLAPSAIFYVALTWSAVAPLNQPHH